MKLRRGRTAYKIPKRHQIFDVVLEGNQKHNQMCAFVLQQIGEHEWKHLRTLMGPPQYFCVGDDDKMWFWPTPDQAYVVKVRYTPPMQEF